MWRKARPQLCQCVLRGSKPSLGSETRFLRSPRLASSVISKRSFHVGPHVETAIQGTQHLITEFHQISHLPWFVAIPFVALGVNLCVRLPLSLYTQRINQRRVQLRPLLQVWYMKHFKEVEQTKAQLPAVKKEKEVVARMKKTSKRLFRELGVQQWRSYGYVFSFPFWLLAIESIRRISGGRSGLLGTLIGSAHSQQQQDTATTAPAAGGTALSVSSTAARSTDIAPTGDGALSTAANALVPGPDPSLATEGCLWFPNLMEADPLAILPFVLSAVLVVNLIPKNKTRRNELFNLNPAPSSPNAPKEIEMQSTVAKGLHRGLMVVSLSIGPLLMDLPSALHLYWISSASFTAAQHAVINRLMPLPESKLRPCKGADIPIIRPAKPRSRS